MSSSAAEKTLRPSHVDVAAAVIKGRDGRLLLAQRPRGKHLAGLWEFPGGKCEPGEAVDVALARELQEELGIEIAGSTPFLSLTHHYPEKSIRLLIHTVDEWQGVARGCEGQNVDWFDLKQIRALPMPAADRPILKLLDVDPRYAVLPDPTDVASSGEFLDQWQAHLDSGSRFLCLSGAALDEPQLAALAMQCAVRAQKVGARWLLNGSAELARTAGADGIHLGNDELRKTCSRPLSHDYIVAATCRTHEDLVLAGELDLDLIYLQHSVTTNKGGSLGGSRLAGQIAASPLPVIIEGPLGSEGLEEVRNIGAFGLSHGRDAIAGAAP